MIRGLHTIGLMAVILAAVPCSAQAQTPAGGDTSMLLPQEIGTVRIGETRRGRLEAGDWMMSDGTYADVWYVHLTAGQRLTIECVGTGFNAYVQLLDPGGRKLSEGAGGGRSAARVSFSAREAGRYQIVINNYSEVPQEGAYQLVLR